MKVNLNFIDTFRAKLETRRLEQRYARRDKRTTYYSNAQYRDGEYFYQDTPSSPEPPRETHSPITSTPSPSYFPPTSPSPPAAAPLKRFSASLSPPPSTTPLPYTVSRNRASYQLSPEFVQAMTAAPAPASGVTTPGAEARIRARMSMPTVKAEEVFAYYRVEKGERRASRGY